MLACHKTTWALQKKQLTIKKQQQSNGASLGISQILLLLHMFTNVFEHYLYHILCSSWGHANQRITNSRNNSSRWRHKCNLTSSFEPCPLIGFKMSFGLQTFKFYLWTKKTCEAWLNWIFSTMESFLILPYWVPWCLMFETPNLLYFLNHFLDHRNLGPCHNWPVFNHRFSVFQKVDSGWG